VRQPAFRFVKQKNLYSTWQVSAPLRVSGCGWLIAGYDLYCEKEPMHTLHGVLAAATRLCVALALVLAPWADSLEARALAAPAAVQTVNVGNNSFTFSPTTTVIAVGDTIHWVWTDNPSLFAHSTTSGTCSGFICTGDGKWDSGLHPPPSSFTFDQVFTQTGTYAYFCINHGPTGMTGTIEVVDFLPITGLAAANSSPTRFGSSTLFTATISSGNSVTYTWSFGDGLAGSDALTSHMYGAPGFYTAVVTATNPISTAVASTPVTVTRSTYLPLIQR
jgi:plastocyanin